MVNFFVFPILQSPSAGGGPENYQLVDILFFIGSVINVAMTLVGAIAIIYLIIGGYQYATSFGNPEGIARAKQTILWAIIGFLVAVAAVSLITFLWNNYIGGVLPPVPQATPTPTPT